MQFLMNWFNSCLQDFKHSAYEFFNDLFWFFIGVLKFLFKASLILIFYLVATMVAVHFFGLGAMGWSMAIGALLVIFMIFRIRIPSVDDRLDAMRYLAKLGREHDR